MSKKLLAILMSVLLLCSMLPLGAIPVFAATSGKTGDCTWTLDGTHLTISGNGKMGDYDQDSNPAPWGYALTSVTIEEGVTSIGDYAFHYCQRLGSVTIPDSVTTIGDSAFCNCFSLASVTIPDSVTSIGNWAFCNCHSLISITIPAGITSIGDHAFYYCDSLTSVTIPDSVTTIGDGTFSGCTRLSSVTIPDSVTSIGDSAFYGCALTSVTIPDGVTTIGRYALAECSSLTSVIIPDSVTSIGYGAFYYCTSLPFITIPDSVIFIDDWAFIECYQLTDVYYHGSKADRANISIGSGNDDLLNATWHYAVCDHSYDSDLDAKCNVCGDVRVISGTTGDCTWTLDGVHLTISGNGAMEDYGYPNRAPWGAAITSVTIGEDVTSIGDYAFYNCSSLASVTIGDSVTHIDSFAFENCSSLTSVTIPNSVTSIGFRAFWDCTSLARIIIPNSVTNIDSDALQGCTSLTRIYFNGTIEQWDTISKGDLWDYNTGFYTVYCLDGTVLKVTILRLKKGIITLKDKCVELKTGIDTINVLMPEHSSKCDNSACALEECIREYDSVCAEFDYFKSQINTLDAEICELEKAEEIDIQKMREINDDMEWLIDSYERGDVIECALDKMESDIRNLRCHLTIVVIPDGVTRIGYAEYKDGTGITSVTIPDSVTSIGTDAFRGCSALTDVYYGGSEADRANISIDSGNDCLLNATWHYAVCDHSYVGTVTTPADCVNTGVMTYTCSDCGDSYTEELPSGIHPYTNACDRDCNVCGAVRVAPHVYDGDCDNTCNLCGIKRQPTADHVYTDDCDATCNVCGAVRTDLGHVYTDSCDRDCNYCGAFREPPHNYADKYDETCDTCGAWREIVIVYGDADGDGAITTMDAVLLSQYLAGWDVTLDAISGDADGDGAITTMDAVLLDQYLAGWNVQLG